MSFDREQIGWRRRPEQMAFVCLMLCVLHSDAAATDRVAVESTEQSLALTLPPVIYAVPGIKTEIFYDNIVRTQNPDMYTFDIQSRLGKSESRHWWLTPNANDIGEHNLIVTVRSADGTQQAVASTTLKVVPASAGAKLTRQIKLLIIGDSLTHASAYPNEIGRLLSQPNNPEWMMMGTHRPASAQPKVSHEGYGGWTWERFVTRYEPDPDGTYRKRSSPFVFLDQNDMPRLNLNRYFESHYQGMHPDYVIIMLGINDCFGAPPDDMAGIDAKIDQVFANADQLVKALRQSAPEARVGICLTTPPNSRQAAFTANYQDRYTRWGWKRIQHRLVQRQLEHFPTTDGIVSVIPTEVSLDPVDGYPDNNAVHPNAHGYQQIGSTIYSWLKWQLSLVTDP